MEWSGEEKRKKHEMQLHELYSNANHSSLIVIKVGARKVKGVDGWTELCMWLMFMEIVRRHLN